MVYGSPIDQGYRAPGPEPSERVLIGRGQRGQVSLAALSGAAPN